MFVYWLSLEIRFVRSHKTLICRYFHRIQLTYGRRLGINHGQSVMKPIYKYSLSLSQNEFINIVRWRECVGTFKGAICQLYIETNTGRSFETQRTFTTDQIHEFIGHRLMYINTTSGYVAGYYVITGITLQFGCCCSHLTRWADFYPPDHVRFGTFMI